MTIEVPVPVSVTSVLAGGAALVNAVASFVAVPGREKAMPSSPEPGSGRVLSTSPWLPGSRMRLCSAVNAPPNALFIGHLSRVLTDVGEERDCPGSLFRYLWRAGVVTGEMVLS